MARTGNHDKTGATATRLRREAPSIVGLLVREEDFAAMRRYRSFAFREHITYLRQMEQLLRVLTAQGVHTTLTVFDPVEFDEFCADADLDPDSVASRARYVADIASAGATVTYDGRPLDRLARRLLDEQDRRAVLDRAMSMLAGAGPVPGSGEDGGRTAYARASQALVRLLQTVGAGRHHLVCSVPDREGPLVAAVSAECGAHGELRLLEAEALVYCTVLAAGIVTGSPGGLVVRSTREAGTDTVRGWVLRDGWPRPLTAAQVFTAYCTDPETGDPVPPEPGVDYQPGIVLPPPEGAG
ncbi:hypothetical protein [Streptomyces sp. TP-A0874]|uniref:hypothetical protein n=1 Tax=Streptomyces sp. TP-A0874 TaxID=549819 RepID=UPI0008532F56|nr:hypothetical protein [Streptomyces sp. TP-A0874]